MWTKDISSHKTFSFSFIHTGKHFSSHTNQKVNKRNMFRKKISEEKETAERKHNLTNTNK